MQSTAKQKHLDLGHFRGFEQKFRHQEIVQCSACLAFTPKFSARSVWANTGCDVPANKIEPNVSSCICRTLFVEGGRVRRIRTFHGSNKNRCLPTFARDRTEKDTSWLKQTPIITENKRECNTNFRICLPLQFGVLCR